MARLPLVVGPIIAAARFALFIRPGVGASYVSGFLPAIVTLGLGMAMTVAPLTTTVMNAVARVAGLVAIAVFGILMAQVSDVQLANAVRTIAMPHEVAQAVLQQRGLLADIPTPDGLPDATAEALRLAIREAFVAGVRAVMGLCTALPLLGAF